MSDSNDALSILFDTTHRVAKSLWSVHWSRHLSRLASLSTAPVRVAWAPLSYILEVFLVLFAPVIYLVAWAAFAVRACFAIVVSLKPLYSFLAAAAGVGILAGIILGISSSLITSYLGMSEADDDYNQRYEQVFRKYQTRTVGINDSRSGKESAGESSSDKEWSWTGTSSTSRQRGYPAGLLSQTIHEEDGDSDI